jgi:threonine synthase
MDKPMLFYSTNRLSPPVNFREALIIGQAPDKGLYMPEKIPVLSEKTILGFAEATYPEIAFEVAWPYLSGVIDSADLKAILKSAYDFKVPLELVRERSYIMRLDQGPTASFKDFAARMMGRLMQHFLKTESKKLLILTATSGDTGSAVANAFYGLDNIEVVVLFPKEEVTNRQRKQMTTLGKNIRVLSLDAKFDDCQALVKQAFSDPELAQLNLSSANSINIGRLIPQIVYYFYAWSRLSKSSQLDTAIISVPSGNFGDMMGGVLAMKMGLPVEKIIIATNENDEFPTFLNSGKYEKIEPSRNCISSAMNVGHPSNLARLVDLYGGRMDEKGNLVQPANMDLMCEELWAVSITDEHTRKTIRDVYREYNVVLEPHGAVGWAGLEKFLWSHPGYSNPEQLCISLETAHPAKFPDEVNKLTGIDPPLPASLQGIDDKEEYLHHLPHNFPSFKTYLITNH